MLPSRPFDPAPTLSNSTPAPLGSAAAGVGTTVSRADHIHPLQASAAPSGAAGGDLGSTYPNPTVTSGANHSHAATQITGAPWSSVLAPATVQTTDATPTTIATLATTTDKGHALDLTLGATLGDRSGMVAFKVLATVTNASGTVTLHDELVTASDGGASGWAVGLTVGGTDITVKVTGAGGTTIDWICAGSMLVHGS